MLRHDDAMEKAKLLHIFKAGTHTTTSGETISFSESDLAATAAAYNPALYQAPLVVGHPRTDDPAQGWAKELIANGADLYAVPVKVSPEFAGSVNEGRFGAISSKFYRPTDPNNPVPGVWYLRHIGFLGAHPPAVKGLTPPEFSDDDEGVCFLEEIAFDAIDFENDDSFLKRVRDFLINKFGLDDAIQTVAPVVQETAEFNESKPVTDEQESPMTDTHDGETAALHAENARLKAEVEQMKQIQAQQAQEQQHSANVQFSESLVEKSKLLPKHKELVVATLDALHQETPVEFGEGDTKTTLMEAFKTFLSEQPEHVQFGEHATKTSAVQFAEKSNSREQLHQQAQQLVAEKGISYEDAIRQLV